MPGGASVKEPSCQCRRCWRCGFNRWVGKIHWRRSWQPTPVVLPGESHGQRSLRASVHRVAKSETQLKQFSMHTLEMPPGKQLHFLSLFKNRIIYLLTAVTSVHKIGLIITLSSAALSYLVHAWIMVVYLFSLWYIVSAAPFSSSWFAPPKYSMILGSPSNT